MTYNGDPSQQYSAPQQQYPQQPQPQPPYGYNQQPQSPPYGNYQQPVAALPTIWPTLLITFFFGIFGLIPASMHTSRAREAGRPTNAYWAAFGWTMAASILLWVLFLVVIASSVHTTSYYPYQ
jgi:hypothetical protein